MADISEFVVPQSNDIEYLMIDGETRQITIPSSQILFGVESDYNSERKYFKCDKIVGDNIDLSKLNLYVNYMNPNGNKDAYLVDDVSVNGDYITFSWLLGRMGMKYKGTINFIVCAKKSESDGTLTNEWNTTTAQGTILEGLEATESIAEENPDIIEQILNKINNIEQGSVSDEQVSKVVQSYLTNNPLSYNDLKDKPTLFDGKYSSLTGLPTIPTLLSQLTGDPTHRLVTDALIKAWNAKSDFSGSYSDLTNKPSFKTVNGVSIEGTGDITVSGGGSSVTVDTELKADSSNPVANSALYKELNKKANLTDLGINIITKTSSDTEVAMENNTYYVFPTMSTLTVTPPTAENGKLSICGFEFTSGSTATTLTLKNCTLTNSDDVVANKTYEVNILNGSAIVRER